MYIYISFSHADILSVKVKKGEYLESSLPSPLSSSSSSTSDGGRERMRMSLFGERLLSLPASLHSHSRSRAQTTEESLLLLPSLLLRFFTLFHQKQKAISKKQ